MNIDPWLICWLLFLAVCMSWAVFWAFVLFMAFVDGFRDERRRIAAARIQAELNRPEEPLSEMTVCRDGEPVRVDLYVKGAE